MQKYCQEGRFSGTKSLDCSSKMSGMASSSPVEFVEKLRVSLFPPLEIMPVAAERGDFMDHDAMLELAAADSTLAGVSYFRANRVVGRNPEVQGILIQAGIKLLSPDHGGSMGFGRADLPERARDRDLRSSRFRHTEGGTRVYLPLWFDIIGVAHDIEPVDAPFAAVFERQFRLGEIDGKPQAFPCRISACTPA